ncbi:MAG: phosphate butyryltransferase [bacterium]
MLNFEDLVAHARKKGLKKVALAVAEEESALKAVKRARDEKIAEPILVGSLDKIKAIASGIGWDLSGIMIVDAPDAAQAAIETVKLVKTGQADIVMKGLLHTDVLLKAVLDKDVGLRTGKLLSHVFLLEVPAYHKLLILSDCAMNIAPTLEEKKCILQNAIDVAVNIGIEKPKVAIVASVEEVNPKMPATLDAAILSKMADRKQIKNAIVDGPLAFDNSISRRAAEEKGIQSPVAGDADILLLPQIEAGNILYKALVYFAGVKAAGIIIGARAPVVLTSRADTEESKFFSIVLAAAIV